MICPSFELEYKDRIWESFDLADQRALGHFIHCARAQSGYWLFRMGGSICVTFGFVFWSRSPIDFTLFVGKVSMLKACLSAQEEEGDNLRCFVVVVEKMQTSERRVHRMHEGTLAALEVGGGVFLLCANDQICHFFPNGEPPKGCFVRVDSEAKKKDFFGDDTVSMPGGLSDFTRRATRVLIFSDIKDPAKLGFISEPFGKSFIPDQVASPEIYRLC